MDKSDIYAEVISSAMLVIWMKQEIEKHTKLIKDSLTYSEFKDGDIDNESAANAFPKANVSIVGADYVKSQATVQSLQFPVHLHEEIGKNGAASMINILKEARLK